MRSDINDWFAHVFKDYELNYNGRPTEKEFLEYATVLRRDDIEGMDEIAFKEAVHVWFVSSNVLPDTFESDLEQKTRIADINLNCRAYNDGNF